MFNFDKELGNVPETQTEIQKNIAKLSHVNVQMRRDAVNALFLPNISDLANQTAIVEAGAIAPLVHMLNDTDTEVKKMASMALTSLIANINPANQTAIVAQGGIAIFVQLLNDDDAVVLLAAVALHQLTFNNPTNQTMVIEAGGVAPLVQLLKHDSITNRQTAAGILFNLAVNMANQAVIVAEGGIAPLVYLLNDADTLVRQKAAGALSNLAATNQAAIVEAGGIAPLVQLLEDTDSDVRQKAAAALGCLAMNDNLANQMAIATEGGIAPLVQLLNDANADVRKHTAFALTNLTLNNPANQATVTAAGSMVILIRLLNDADFAVRKQVIATLFALALNNPANQTVIVDSGALAVLERFSRTESDVTTQQYAQGVILTCRFTELKAQKQAQAEKQQEELIRHPQRILSAASTPAQTYQDPFNFLNSSAMDTAWNTTSTKAPVKASTDWTMSDFATGAPPRPPKPIITALSEMSVSPTGLRNISARALELKEPPLAQGGFGVVYEGMWNGRRVAVKKLKGTLTPDLLEEFRRESEIHARLHQNNIIALYGVCVESMNALVLEFMPYGSLYMVLKRPPVALTLTVQLSLSLDIVSGLLYLHSQNIIHRDLKSLNVLVDEQMQAKISDFGLSKIKVHTASGTKAMGSSLGSLYWKAPELFKLGGQCTKATDIYALAIVFWEIVTQQLPYASAEGDTDVIRGWVKDGEREPIPNNLLGPLIQRCWAQRAEDRPVIEEVMIDIRKIHAAEASKTIAVDSGFEYSGKLR